ncbi:MAG: response regulator [Elusimicrobiota bacterium]
MAGATHDREGDLKPAHAKTVVVTDDNEDLRSYAATVIEQRGHRVLAVAGGAETLDAFSRERVDLLVLDVMMPDMDGYETLSRLRAAGHTRLPVIMLTAQDSDDAVISGYHAGADYYVTKPYKSSTLLNIVDYLIGDLPADERAALAAKL